MTYWVVWNRQVARFEDGHRPYVRYRLEDLTHDTLAQVATLVGGRPTPVEVEQSLTLVPNRYNARRRDESITLASQPDTVLTADLLTLAGELGYAPERV
jgi:hypothetical protein